MENLDYVENAEYVDGDGVLRSAVERHGQRGLLGLHGLRRMPRSAAECRRVSRSTMDYAEYTECS